MNCTFLRLFRAGVLAAIASLEAFAQTNAPVSQQTNAGGKAQSNFFTIAGALGQPTPPGRAASEQFVIFSGFISLFEAGGKPSLGQPVLLETPQVGNALTLTIAPPPNYQATTRQLFYRLAGQRSYQAANLIASGNQLEGTIPPEFVTIRGVEYYVRLFDGQTEVTFPPFDPINNPAVLQVQVNRLAYPNTLPAQAPRMVSIPLVLRDANVDAVLADDLGEYNTLPRRWRVFRWQNEKYAEHPAIDSTLTPGAAFWLITRDSTVFDVENAQSVNSSGVFNLTLQPGWNQVGNPFAFEVDWNDVLAASAPQAGSQVQAPVRWNGSDYEYDQITLAPWEGYFVFNLSSSPVTLLVPPREPQGDLGKAATLFSENEILLQIKMRGLTSGWKDEQNFVGMREGATNELDRLDFFEAPPLGDHIRLSIIDDYVYAGNFHAVSAAGSFWDLRLSTTGGKENIRLTFLERQKLPANFQIWLLNTDRQSSLPISQGQVELEIASKGATTNLRLIVGTAKFANESNAGIPLIPYQFILHQNYPNPFDRSTEGSRQSPETKIGYELAERAEVKLEIYNLLGQKIRVLINATQSAGAYTLNWDGKDQRGNLANSGVYFYRLKAGAFVAVRKLVVSR